MLVPEVDVSKRYYLERGEQMTVFRVQSSRYGSRFFELHILEVTRPPAIIGINELDAGEVVEKLASREMLSILSKTERVDSPCGSDEIGHRLWPNLSGTGAGQVEGPMPAA